ncbi:Olfactory Receptor 7A5 [Manis pentadactyla]|nr:Olfactory Receptor 7A5 [Manis pentadactyla]
MGQHAEGDGKTEDGERWCQRMEPELKFLIFGVLLSMSLVTVFGNLLLILAVSSDSHLHTPVYFFLSDLPFVDICFFSTTIPKMLLSILTQSKGMTYAGCTSQMYVSYSLHLHPMEPGNLTRVSEFHLLGFSEDPPLQSLIFRLFLSMYLITVFGNLLLILADSSDSHLHTPMYFFLSKLSFVDICFTSTTIPKMLWTIQTEQ